ncbi:MAG: divergent PAP2 family protein [Spirochaetota bacterium]
MEWFPQVLLTAAGVQVFCQVFKLAYYSLRDRRFRPAYFVTAGGIPSAHSAFVTALTVAIGIRNGFASDIFALAFVFSAIVIYDAYRLRGHVQHHAQIINRAILAPAGEAPISEMVGHSLTEIVTGMVLGGGVSALATLALA